MASSTFSRGERTSERSARAARSADRRYCDVVLRRAIRSGRSAVAGHGVPGDCSTSPFLEANATTIGRLARRLLSTAVPALACAVAACAPLSRPAEEGALTNVPSEESCAAAVAAAPKDSALVKVRVALAFAERGPDVRAIQRSVLSDVLSQVEFPDVLDTEMGFCGDPTEVTRHYAHAQPHPYDSRVWFRVRSDGALDSLAVIVPSLSPEIQNRVIGAIMNAGSTKRLGIPPPGVSQLIYVVSIYADSGHENVPVFDSLFIRGPRARSPKASPVNGKPIYPSGLQAAAVEGTVVTQFVIDRNGRMRRGSLRILQSSAPQFTEVVSSYLTRALFRPATVGNCPVPAIVEMPFEFALGSPP